MDEKRPEKQEAEAEEAAGEAEAAADQPPTMTTYVVVPPDGGWGWVIVAASFMCNLVVDGIVFSYGVFLEEITEEFKVSKAKVTLAGSLLSGLYMVSGPFVSGMANRYGFRVVSIAGSIFGCLCFILSSFAPSIEFLWLSYGILGGIGFGLIYVPAVIACGFYFEKWRALATGIAVCGSGIGTIVMAPFTTFLIGQFGWRGTLLIQSGIILNCAVFGALFRPLKPVHVAVPEEERDEEGGEPDPGKMPLMQRIKQARDNLRRADSVVSIERDVEIAAAPPTEASSKLLRASHNTSYPTAAQVLHASSASLAKSRHSLASGQNHVRPAEEPNAQEAPNQEHLVETSHQDEVFLFSRKHSKAAVVESSSRRESITLRYRTRTVSETSHRSGSRSRRNTLSKGEAGVRPLYREDIFLQASLGRLPQYTSQGSGLDYTMSVTHLPTWKDVQEEEESCCQVCPEAVRRTLATMLDFSLLASPTFLLFCLSGFFAMMGLFVPFMYLADRAYMNGIEKATAVGLVSSIGITNTLGRIICGVITSIPSIDSLLINNIALTVGGIATMVSGVSYHLGYQLFYTAVFGLSIACFASLRSILIVDLFGLETLTNAFGLLLLFQGAAAAIGSPIAGAFQDMTGSYTASFVLSGSLLLLSGVMCYPLNWLNNWEKRRAAAKSSRRNSFV